MVQVRASSPPSSNGGEAVPNGLHHLVQHNSIASFSPDSFEYDDVSQLMPGYESSFSSPAPQYRDDTYHYESQCKSYSYPYGYRNSGLGTRYDTYSPEPNQYSRVHDKHQMFSSQYGMPAGSPPTPSMPTAIVDTMRTRSGLAINRIVMPHTPSPQSKPKRARTPRSRKTKKDAGRPENRVAKLQKPLSELTKDWDHVPIVDIEAYVNRPAEERRKEVEDGKIPGKVKRPMNSFMLYRKAYQNRTKNWCLQNNHQIVSQVCGDSWPLEPKEVRDQFNEWSRIERINHQNAHPGYKFSPSKTVPVKTPKRKVSEEFDSGESELEDFDWEKGVAKKQKKTPSSVPRRNENTSHPNSRSPFMYSQEISENPSFSTRYTSSYQASNPGKPAPAPYEHSSSSLGSGHYYQQKVHRNTTYDLGTVEDVVMRKTPAPAMHYLGVPGGRPYAMMDQSRSQDNLLTSDYKIDPYLMAQDHTTYDSKHIQQESMYLEGNQHNDQPWHGGHEANYREIYDEYHGLGGGQSLHLQEEQLQMLKGGQDGWSVEPLDVGQEFDKWMDEV